MTFAAACTWSLLRSLVIAAAGLAIAAPLKETLREASGRLSLWLWTLVLMPVFVPGLLVGYGYRNFALSLVHLPVWNELLYAALVMLQVVPVGVLILACSPPPPVSASALHVRRLTTRRARDDSAREGTTWEGEGPAEPLTLTRAGSAGASPSREFSRSRNAAHSRWAFAEAWLRHHLFAVLPAGAAMFLLAFQESEIATLMQARSWTEWLFTRFFAGLEIAAALKTLILPVIIPLAVIGAAFWVVASSGTGRGTLTQTHPMSLAERSRRWLAVGYLGTALVLLAGVPGAIVLRGTWEGLSVLRAHRTLLGEIGVALLMAVTAGVLTWIVSGLLTRPQSRFIRFAAGVALLPGLMGALPLGVAIAGLVQREPWVIVRDSPLPLVLSEFCFLLPRAVLLRLLIGRLRESSSVHAARLLAESEDGRRRSAAAALLWRLDVAGRWGGMLIVCYWAYVELTLPPLLAPPGMTPAPVVLYNLMHYGQISGLSAMLFATMAVPVVLMGIGWWGFRAFAGRFHTT